MIDRLEQQTKLTSNQWKLICTANVADLLDFFDFFLIGYVTAALTKEWSLTYWQGGAILLASGLGAVPGAFVWGWLGDKIGRRTVFIWSSVTISLATGIMVLTPGPQALVPGWLFLMFFRFFVGIGNAGIFTIDLPLVQEFIPTYKRGWVAALITTLLPGGSLLAGIIAASLLPVIGWRGLFLVGLSPIVLVLMIRFWVPESPRWLMRVGRHEEARRSLAWALMIDPAEIALPPSLPASEQPTRWLDLFKYPRLVAAGCLTGLTQTGGASLGLWGATLLVIVLNTTPAHAAFLMIFVNLAGILGRFSITALIEPMGRRGSGTLYCVLAAALIVAAGYLYDVYLGSWSVFYMLIVAQGFFSSAIYTVVGPYMTEIWPSRLRSSGMGLSYGVGNMGGKVFGPLGLALIMGAGDIIKPAAPNLKMLAPAFIYFASWYLLGVVGFWVFGYETKGRSFEDIDRTLDGQPTPLSQTATVAAK
ncbi:MAG: MFS transporter [Alphaproteobacteria bacterium]|nr:MFS transporter [Alphaproteobacteria bacterium]